MSPDRPVQPARETTGGASGIWALFALVFAARAWLIHVWGSPVPYLEQWGCDALDLFGPWRGGTFHWSSLFTAHNEHRIVLTQLANLALFIVGRGWNIWGQLLLNAVLHAATAATVARIFWPYLRGPGRTIWLLGLAVVFSTLAGWQNALWGFQSQVYFEILLSVLALGGLLGSEPFHRNWWLGWIASLLALFALGSGLLAAITVMLISGFGLLFPRPDHSILSKSTGGALFAVFLVVALGWALKVEVPLHASLRAHSAMQFGAVFARGLGWPWVDSGWLWLVMQAPMLWLTGRLIYERRAPNTSERLTLGLGLLAALHAAAVAFSRGGGLLEARPLSRYQDVLLLGVAANLFALLQLAGSRRAVRIAGLFWAGTLLAGLLMITTSVLSVYLPFKRARDANCLAQVRAYLATHDAAVFTPDANAAYPDPAVPVRVLDDPRLQGALPAEFFDPATAQPRVIEYSPWLMLLSAAWLLIEAIRCRPARLLEKTLRPPP